MKFANFFIARPIFATVVSIITLIIGSLAYTNLPVAQYPEVAPPTVVVSATYPGANAETAAKTVATPLEQEINGVENMLYMSSNSTNDGTVQITVTFKLGTDLDEAQVLVQNRVAIAEPRLPEQVRRLGVTTRKNSPNMLLVVNLFSPNGTYDQTYIANYVTLQIKDVLSRINGVGEVRVFGASPYSMRIWLNPYKMASLDITAGDAMAALRSQNIQVASGTLNTPPVEDQNAFELNVQTQGRLIEPEAFGNIVVKSDGDGRLVRIRDIGRVELGAESYSTKGYLGKKAAIALPVFQRPGTNALDTSDAIIETMKELEKDFPPDLEYRIIYNPTKFVEQSIDAVIETMLEAVFLVVLVIFVFLQSWRAAIIPIIAIPVSLIGTFAVMQAFGFSLNNLTLFGLVLAIGIVVDDAIVVVENMERNMANGMGAREAAFTSMKEVGSALVATSLVLVAVFLPTAFVEGISGRFYQQFGMTVAVATVISTIVSLTLSPSISALIFKPTHNDPDAHPNPRKQPLRYFFCRFNHYMEEASEFYQRYIATYVRKPMVILLAFAGLIIFAGFMFSRVPTGFIPQQDQGYYIIGIELPPGSSLQRTDEVIQEVIEKLIETDGVENAVAFSGFSGATFSAASNAGAIFPVLESFKMREDKGITYDSLLNSLRQKMNTIDEAFVVVIPPPPVRGIGSGGGFKMMIQDRGGVGLDALKEATFAMMGAAQERPEVTGVYSFFNTDTPQLYLDIDRVRAEKLGVPVSNIFEALEIYLGSSFVNDFNYLGRTFRVTAQADAPYRMTEEDISRIKVRNRSGGMVPLGSVTVFRDDAGPARVPRYNLYQSAELSGDTAAGYSSGEAIAAMEELAEQVLPEGVGFEWTEIAYQQKNAGNTAAIAFTLAVIFVFLLLSAQYESWVLPLAVVLIVPMCLLSSITGIAIAGMDNNILTQIGFVVLIGLACKNAILIVEFCKQKEDEGMDMWEAAKEAGRIRLRPILMTSFAFILGVVPLVLASGAAAEMRQALGVSVFSGMIGVTFFGLAFTPIFYVVVRKLAQRLRQHFMGESAN